MRVRSSLYWMSGRAGGMITARSVGLDVEGRGEVVDGTQQDGFLVEVAYDK